MKFNSKIDIRLGFLIIGAASLMLKAAYMIASRPQGIIEAFMLAALGSALPVWILLATSYVVTEEYLWIRSGPFRWKIPVSSISKIEFSKSWVSSPALSFERIKIEYDRGKAIMVSPKEPGKFLHTLRASIAQSS